MGKMRPEARAAVQAGVREDLNKLLLSELRKLAGKTQQELADSLKIKQPTLSKLEGQQDMQVSTLRRIVEALGGELDITATLPTGRVSLSQFKNKSKKTPAPRFRSDRNHSKH
jgi:transcriptional regulator with XRE-family HTH domain